MAKASKAQALLQDYLAKVEAGLRGLPKEQAADILQELRSHVIDRAGDMLSEAKLQEALLALGDPAQLAGQYVTQDLFDRTSVTRSPALMLRSLFHWATLSLQGFAVALASLFLYLVGGAMLLLAVAKPFNPDRVGVWTMNPDGTLAGAHSLQIALHGTVQGHELLGWWIVPLGLFLGLSLIVLTYRLDLEAIKRFRGLRPPLS